MREVEMGIPGVHQAGLFGKLQDGRVEVLVLGGSRQLSQLVRIKAGQQEQQPLGIGIQVPEAPREGALDVPVHRHRAGQQS